MESTIKTVGVIGLGLIGGSMAKAIKSGTDCKVLGSDTNKETIQLAKMTKGIDNELKTEDLRNCDLIFIAIAPKALVTWVKENAQYFSHSAILVDLCGVKCEIMNAIEPLAKEYEFSYIGGHPMAGKEVSGYRNADSDLFWGASMILTPPLGTDIRILSTLKDFFIKLGFTSIVFSTKEEHDRIIAYTSQLAHITSSAYIKSKTAESHMGFSAGSYKDMTRVARLDPDMWTELFLDNADNLESELSTLIDNLSDYLDALKKRNPEKLRSLLNDGLMIKQKESKEKR